MVGEDMVMPLVGLVREPERVLEKGVEEQGLQYR